jgi:large subunit ribosomal protein L24
VGTRIKKGDTVEVIAGDDKGERGTVARVIPATNRVVIQGVNIVKKAQRPRPTGGRTRTPPGIIEFEAPLHLSDVMLVCPHCDNAVRVGSTRDEDGQTVRVCKNCGEEID